jgi:hypothetical protein
VSLAVIGVTMALTTVASLIKARRDDRTITPAEASQAEASQAEAPQG